MRGPFAPATVVPPPASGARAAVSRILPGPSLHRDTRGHESFLRRDTSHRRRVPRRRRHASDKAESARVSAPVATALEWGLGAVTAVLVVVVAAGAVLVRRLLRERRRAYDEVATNATLNRAVLDATEDGIRLVDLEGRTLLANPTIEQLTSEVFGFGHQSTLHERSSIAPRLRDARDFL